MVPDRNSYIWVGGIKEWKWLGPKAGKGCGKELGVLGRHQDVMRGGLLQAAAEGQKRVCKEMEGLGVPWVCT